MERGNVFGYDLLFAGLIVFMMGFLAVYALASETAGLREGAEVFALQRVAISLADSITGSSNANSPEAGSAFWDAEKLRVESGIVDYALLASTGRGFREKNLALAGSGLGIADVSLFYVSGVYEEVFAANEMRGERCAVAERLILVRKALPEKAVLRVVVCGGPRDLSQH